MFILHFTVTHFTFAVLRVLFKIANVWLYNNNLLWYFEITNMGISIEVYVCGFSLVTMMT